MNTNLVAPQQGFDVGALYAGRYVKAGDLNGQTFSAVITGVERVEIPETDGSMRPKAAVTLQGWPAKLLLNKTNFEVIATAYGRQSSGWIGQQLEVFPDITSFSGRTVACFRVRIPRASAPMNAFPSSSAAATIAVTAAATPSIPQAAVPSPSAPTAAIGEAIPY